MNIEEKNESISLAFSMQANKGVYALFLGSGVSLSAGIPTGWDVVKDLVHKLSVLKGVNGHEDLIKWYQETFDKDPEYSDLLFQIAKTPTERNGLMRSYFEPTEEEAKEGLKQPTKAHRAIAQLMKKGYVKVVVTTNFDRLLESALADVGITPYVICNESDIEGAVPLVHAQHTIVKINGDYKDCRFKNTNDELSGYTAVWTNYLSRIMEDYGLITCGWSATWDIALVDIIKAKLNCRYNSTFTYKGKSTPALEELAHLKHGNLMGIQSADDFFSELLENVEALEYVNRNRPLSADIAVARLKKYIVNPQGIIQLHDLFVDEVAQAIQTLNGCVVSNEDCTPDLFLKIYKHTEASLDILLPMLVEAIHWSSNQDQENIIVDSVDCILNREINLNSGNTHTVGLNYFAPTVLFYTCCTYCIRFEKFHLLNSILTIELTSRQFAYHAVNEGAVVLRYNTWIIDKNANVSSSRYYHPANHLAYEYISKHFPYERLQSDFYVMEKLIGMYYAYLAPCNNGDVLLTVPRGNFDYAYPYSPEAKRLEAFFERIEVKKEKSAFIKGGMFNGSYAFYSEIKNKYDAFCKEHSARF